MHRIMSNVPHGELPLQYSTGDRCTECALPLSMYNPYQVCGPCRHRISTHTPPELLEEEAADNAEGRSFLWERFPRRRALRRGPLLPETLAG